MSAAPPSICKNAAIMEMTADGKMKQLRAGTNGWMCMTEADGTPMCLDKEWQSWADGWINKKDPQVKNVGLAYMLEGDPSSSRRQRSRPLSPARSHQAARDTSMSRR